MISKLLQTTAKSFTSANSASFTSVRIISCVRDQLIDYNISMKLESLQIFAMILMFFYFFFSAKSSS